MNGEDETAAHRERRKKDRATSLDGIWAEKVDLNMAAPQILRDLSAKKPPRSRSVKDPTGGFSSA